jgi:hypothetical protein
VAPTGAILVKALPPDLEPKLEVFRREEVVGVAEAEEEVVRVAGNACAV